MVLEGKIFQLIILLVFSVFIVYGIQSSSRGKVRKFGTPEAILAIDEAIGRCVEMGRPFLFQTGIGDISGDGGSFCPVLGDLVGGSPNMYRPRF
jgi:hypothetical protein